MKKSFWTPLFLVIFSLVGCKRNGEPLTPTQMLAGFNTTGKTWQLVEQSLDGDIAAIASCVTDDRTTFFPNLSYDFNEGAAKCDPTDPQSVTGAWVFDQNETHLLITNGSDVTDYEILMLNEGILILKTRFLELEVITTFNPS